MVIVILFIKILESKVIKPLVLHLRRFSLSLFCIPPPSPRTGKQIQGISLYFDTLYPHFFVMPIFFKPQNFFTPIFFHHPKKFSTPFFTPFFSTAFFYLQNFFTHIFYTPFFWNVGSSENRKMEIRKSRNSENWKFGSLVNRKFGNSENRKIGGSETRKFGKSESQKERVS